jgi:hypothetical protein
MFICAQAFTLEPHLPRQEDDTSPLPTSIPKYTHPLFVNFLQVDLVYYINVPLIIKEKGNDLFPLEVYVSCNLRIP